MANKHTEPLVLIQNRNSTNYRRVRSEVIDPLREALASSDEDAYSLTIYNTKFPDTERNIAHMIEKLPDEARVIVAAGDGTVEQVINASIRGEKNLTIGALPYGNFNDIAFAHMRRGQGVLNMIGDDVPTREVNPLTIEVDGKHWIDAASYASFGLTAIIASGFRSQKVRDLLRPLPRPLQKAIRNTRSGADYLTHAWTDKLPDFRVDGGELQIGMTDVAFANNPLIAGIIKAEDTYYDTPYFGALSGINMGDMSKLITWGVPSLQGHSPLERAEQMRVSFEKEATIPVQIGGEYHEISSPTEVFVYKDPSKKVRMLHPIAATTVS